MNTRVSRRFRPFDMKGCVLYLPLYAYGANAQYAWDQSGRGNHGTISGPGPGSYPMVGPDFIKNGGFDSDTVWTTGSETAGWTIAGGVATKIFAVDEWLEQGIVSVVGTSYVLEYDLVRTAGTITPYIGNDAGVARNASGTYREEITCTNIGTLNFRADLSFVGTLDNVSMQKIFGRESLGWRFDGVDDRILCANSASMDGITAATAIMWVKVGPGGAAADRILSMYKPSNAQWHLEIGTHAPTPGNLSIYTPALTIWTDTGAVLEDNTYKNIVVTISATALRVYIDGVYQTQLTSGISTGTGDSSISLGGVYAGGSALPMMFGEFGFFSRAFDLAEIKSYFELTRSRYGV